MMLTMTVREEGEQRSCDKAQVHIHCEAGENDKHYTKINEEKINSVTNIEDNTGKTESSGRGVVDQVEINGKIEADDQMEVSDQIGADGQMEVSYQIEADGQMEVSDQIEAAGQMEISDETEAGDQMEVSDQIEADGQMMAHYFIKADILSPESDIADEAGHDKDYFHIHTSSSGSLSNVKKLCNTDESNAAENEALKTMYEKEAENRDKTDESEADSKDEILDVIKEYENNCEVEVKIQ